MSRRGKGGAPKPASGGSPERHPPGRPWQSVRPDKIERARKLIRDPNYPGPKVVNAVARLLAKHL
ncbi:MAG: hypothetical protein QOF48_1363 [Verrucomicrobiota bacterium]|jgi:hypothetical protein